jgi:hypothetical protein
MPKKKNILGTELKQCNSSLSNQNDSSINGYCNEPSTGFHNICLNMNSFVSNNFSELTGQSDWSKKRIDNNHCVCQGAWANYIAKLKQMGNYEQLPIGILKCDAIPEDVLKKYKNEFRTWNNVTIYNQHKDGIEEIDRQCFNNKNKASFQ